jgi:hypothetical protein
MSNCLHSGTLATRQRASVAVGRPSVVRRSSVGRPSGVGRRARGKSLSSPIQAAITNANDAY